MTPSELVSSEIGERTRRRVNRRLMPFLFVLYLVAYLDRVNLGFAGLNMTRELGFSNAVIEHIFPWPLNHFVGRLSDQRFVAKHAEKVGRLLSPAMDLAVDVWIRAMDRVKPR